MRIPRIFTHANLQPNTTIELESQASHHLNKVLRFKTGSSIIVFNGQGGQYTASIASISKKNLLIDVYQFNNVECESPLYIHLGIAVSRGERMDHIMQKSTELGVSEVTPLFGERSEVKLKGERLEKKLQHWKGVVVSACEQCGRTTLPILNFPQSLESWVSKSTMDQNFVLHHRTDQRLGNMPITDNAGLLIGPEGGLTQAEIKFAQDHNFNTLSLGPRVLRTETAPLAAITLLQHCWGDM